MTSPTPATDVPEAARTGLPRFGILLALMIVDVMVTPLLPTWLSLVMSAALLTAALGAVGVRRGGLLLFGVTAAAIMLEGFAHAEPVAVASLVLRTIFLGYVTVRIIWHVVGERDVSHDTVWAVACGYLLIGLVWGGLYACLEALRPGSFVIPAGWTSAPGGNERALAYFSFITLTSVGLGDILPAGPHAGGLCVSEAIVGQLYLAIMVARMVGILAGRQPG